jgi:hypothetical protein
MIMLGNIDSNFFMYFAKVQVDCYLKLGSDRSNATRRL